MEYIIKTHELVKKFNGLTAVDHIDLFVKNGQITALLGGNGAGKTTTLTMLLGLMVPTSGRIEIMGHDIIKNRFSVLPFMNFSSPYVDLPNRLTVRQNLTVYGHFYGVSGLKKRIEELAEQLQLLPYLDRAQGSLSAGQKTRATLAKALLNKPKLLLLDEPTASLDPDTADWVRSLLSTYQQETGAAIFMASHNMFEVERMCHNVVMMQKGRIVDQGKPVDLIKKYGQQNLEEVFLDIARSRTVIS